MNATTTYVGMLAVFLVIIWIAKPSSDVNEFYTPQCHIDTVYVQDNTLFDSLQMHIRNQDRYILMLENQNKVLGHYNSQR